MRNQRGSVTLFVLIAMLFFLIIAMTAYVSASGKLQGQNAEIARIRASYEKDLDDESLQQLYNRLTKTREWFKGSGTLEDTYKIYTIEDLVAFSIKSNGGDNFTNQYVELMNDLDFNEDRSYAKADRTDFGDINGDGTVDTLKIELTTGKGFPCIADRVANARFCGIFLGNQHEIRNAYMYNTVNQAWIGFFGRVGNATIQDLTLSGNYTTTVTAVFGGIIGQTDSNSTNIKNCHSKVNISSSSASYTLGGIVGEVDGPCNIANCHNDGNIRGSNNAGGIVGLNANTLNITNCYNTGNVTNHLGAYAGGLVGRDHAATDNITISKSYNTGKILGKIRTGGFTGSISGALNVSDSYNEGDVTSIGVPSSSNAIYVGGITGTFGNGNQNIITNCHNTGNVTSEATTATDQSIYIGGIVGSKGGLNECSISGCYNTGALTSKATSATRTINSGGIIGYMKNGVIQNCYNTGKITEGNRVGGIMGIAYGSDTDRVYAKIVNCYNTGDIECLHLTNSSNYTSRGSGIGGMAWYANIDMLNCYNTGDINTYAQSGGFVLSNGSAGNIVNYINCYNTGDITSSNSHASGIQPISATSSDIINNFNNVYSIGNIQGRSSSSAICRNYPECTFNITNAYFKDNVAVGVANIATDPSTKMTQAEMTNASFVDTLNNNKNSINLSSYGLGDYTLSSWKQGTDGYPTFDW